MQQLLTVALLDLCRNGIEGVHTGQLFVTQCSGLVGEKELHPFYSKCFHRYRHRHRHSRDGMKDEEIDRYRLSDVWSLGNVNASAGSFRYPQLDLFSLGAIAN